MEIRTLRYFLAVAREENISDTIPLMVPTMETAAMAASPTDETSAVDTMPMIMIKNG